MKEHKNINCKFLQKLTTIGGNTHYVCSAGGDCSLKKDCFYQQNPVPHLEAKIKELKAERNKYKKQYRQNRLDRKKYKQALKEIKEKAQENNELLQGYHHEWANNKLILDIINEVLKDE